MPKRIGKMIRKARLAEGLTQIELENKTSIAQPVLSNLETGNIEPNENQLRTLESVLGKMNLEPDAGIFGEWLRSEREKKKLTVSELAKNSGVRTVTIYNLEAGRSNNPQAITRRGLEDALKEKVPEDVSQEVSSESQIKGLGELVDFNPSENVELPTYPGVYVFYDVSERPIYVGKAKRIADRAPTHREKFWFKHPIVSDAACIRIGDAELRHKVEQVLIKFLKKNVVVNKQSVDRQEGDDD
jgi:transcriptional regulator with XRE-family HTH domain